MNEIQAVSNSSIMSIDTIKEYGIAIHELLESIMVQGKHYDTLPGVSNKPILLKAGAEKIGMMFQFAFEYEVERMDHENGHREYQVICKARHRNSGAYLGSGVGTCTTLEPKYRYRWETIDEDIPSDWKERKDYYKANGFRVKKLNGWVYQRKTDNPDIAEVYNTILKMAKKRAMVDCVNTVTAASDIFDVDIEEWKDDPSKEGMIQDRSPQVTAEQKALESYNKLKSELVFKGILTTDDIAGMLQEAGAKDFSELSMDEKRAFYKMLKDKATEKPTERNLGTLDDRLRELSECAIRDKVISSDEMMKVLEKEFGVIKFADLDDAQKQLMIDYIDGKLKGE